MTTFANIVLASAALLVSTGALSAQTKGTADIPFAFHVPGRTLAAGKYEVTTHTGNRDTARIRSLDSNESTYVLTPAPLRAPYQGREEKSRLVFACGSGECALAEIWIGDEGQSVPVHSHHARNERLAMISINLPRE